MKKKSQAVAIVQRCAECGRNVENDPIARLEHVATAHPLRIVQGFQKLAPLARQLGAAIGAKVKAAK